MRFARPLTESDWHLLNYLIGRYGVDELVRAIRLRQMTEILDPKEIPSDHQDKAQAQDEAQPD